MYTGDTQTILDYPRMSGYGQPPCLSIRVHRRYPDYPGLSEDVWLWPTPMSEYPRTPEIPRLDYPGLSQDVWLRPTPVSEYPRIHRRYQTIPDYPRMSGYGQPLCLSIRVYTGDIRLSRTIPGCLAKTNPCV